MDRRMLRWLMDTPVIGCDGKPIGTVRDLKRGSPKRARINRLIRECNQRALEELRAKKSPRYRTLVRKMVKSYDGHTIPEWLKRHERAAARIAAAQPKRRRKRKPKRRRYY